MTRWALLALLPSTVMIGAATDHEEVLPAAVPAIEMKLVQPKRIEEPPAFELTALRRDAKAGEPLDAFESRSWFVPPPAPPSAPARVELLLPPAPTAPQLPFSFLGQYREDDQLVILLMKGERMLLVRVGEVIDGNYSVEGIEGRLLTLLYLPLGVRQTLDVEAPG
jgi:hypothetical protein